MRSMITLGHTDEELTAAQWDVVDALRRGVDGIDAGPDTQRELNKLLARSSLSSPEGWAAGAAESLANTIARLRTDVEKKGRALDRLRRERDSLKRIVADHDANPLHEQIEALTEECDHWRDLTASAARRAQTLENAQRADRAELDRLRESVADLNRIVAEQQMALNGEFD